MKKGDIVLHDGFKVEIRRGAPVRFGERRAIVKRLVDGQSYAVSLCRLTPLADEQAQSVRCAKCNHLLMPGAGRCDLCGTPAAKA